MPLPLPKTRPDRPRRRVVPSDQAPKELPSRTYSFDPNAARQAWRQVARTRGANAMRLDGRDPGSRLAPLALGLVAIVAAVLWWSNGDEPDASPSEASVANAAAPAPTEPAPEQEPQAADRFGLLGGIPAPAEDPLPPPMPEDGSVAEPPLTAPVAALAKALPPDTPREHVKVLRKLPHSSNDRAPVGGVGREGLHIDRITMGTHYAQGICSGPVGKFSIETDRTANVCFRAVHRRVEQRVIVRWEKNGRLVRRTFVKIGDGHGYRTRAALKLRRKYAGQWTVRIMSESGIELASQSFQVRA